MEIRKKLQKQIWNLQRFAFIPPNLGKRFANHGTSVLLTSMPKAGTHLLERAICLSPHHFRRYYPTITPKSSISRGGIAQIVNGMRSGQLEVAHIPYSEESSSVVIQRSIKLVTVVRHPIAALYSNINHIIKYSDHPLHDDLSSIKHIDDRVRFRLSQRKEVTGTPSIIEQLLSFIAWEPVGALLFRYEDLIGVMGDGSASKQQESLVKLYTYLCPTLSSDDVTELVSKNSEKIFFTGSPTFRSGSIGGWQEAFSHDLQDEICSRFMEELAQYDAIDLVGRYGYDLRSGL